MYKLYLLHILNMYLWIAESGNYVMSHYYINEKKTIVLYNFRSIYLFFSDLMYIYNA